MVNAAIRMIHANERDDGQSRECQDRCTDTLLRLERAVERLERERQKQKGKSNVLGAAAGDILTDNDPKDLAELMRTPSVLEPTRIKAKGDYPIGITSETCDMPNNSVRCGEICPENKKDYPQFRKDTCGREVGHRGPHRSKDREWQQMAKASTLRKKGI